MSGTRSENGDGYRRQFKEWQVTLGATTRAPDGTLRPMTHVTHVTEDAIIEHELHFNGSDSDFPMIHFGPKYPGGLMIFGKRAYSEEELQLAFERVRDFDYKVADTRPEWAHLAEIQPSVTAARILQRAIAVTVPSGGGIGEYSDFEFTEIVNFLRALWRDMDVLWTEEFGKPVPQIPIIAPDRTTAEDQILNALRIVRAWCSARCKPTGTRRSAKAARNAEFLRLHAQGMGPKEIATAWNKKNPLQTVKPGAVATFLSRNPPQKD